jgi:hypothetical protein
VPNLSAAQSVIAAHAGQRSRVTKNVRRKRPAGKARRRPQPEQRTAAPTVEADRRGCLWGGCVWAAVPLLLCAVLVPVSLDLVPSWSAKLGHGIRGTFTAQYCERGKAGCYWIGDFVSDDGTDQRYGVGVDGDSAIIAAGQQIPALDTGDRVNVYPADGGKDWILTTIFAVLLLAALGAWVVRMPVAAVRHTANRRSVERTST